MTDVRPSGLADQLRWVHDMLRRDLATVHQLAADVRDGTTAADVRAELDTLQSNGLVFQLRVRCLSYCRDVHSHHGNEDALLFPAVRRAAPHLIRALDRLEADHRTVSGLLDEIEKLANDDAGTPALAEALDSLSAHLLEHLKVEEKALVPILESWSTQPEQMPPEIRARAGMQRDRFPASPPPACTMRPQSE